MNAKVTGIVAYITWIGLIIAFVAGDRENAKFHLNQALVIWILGLIGLIIGIIPLVGGIIRWIIEIVCLVCAIYGIICAATGEEKEIPVLGSIKLLK